MARNKTSAIQPSNNVATTMHGEIPHHRTLAKEKFFNTRILVSQGITFTAGIQDTMSEFG